MSRLLPGSIGSVVVAVAGALLAVSGCAQDAADAADSALDADELSTATRMPDGSYTVYGAALNRCSTESVRGLSEQLIAEMNCMHPNEMVRIDDISGVTLNGAVFPYLQRAAAASLRQVAEQRGSVQINSALRALPQQYMLYRWSLRDRCGVTVAAPPGTSLHESGTAIDVGNWSSLKKTMDSNSFDWFGSSDAVHFTYVGEDTTDVAGDSIRAFVSLWNRNHPEDLLPPETDRYTPAVGLRIMKAPSNGFEMGAFCSIP